ncbi:hypothetical protein [Streptomyces phage phiScoe3]|nr:hypothetical protein [Streptomyces phage phiScoe3]
MSRSTPAKELRGPVTVVKRGVGHLDPLVRREALRRAGGDALRVVVVSPTEAVVLNHRVA